jgi:hypothetical protein
MCPAGWRGFPNRRQRTDVRGQITEAGSQRTEDRGQKTEVRRQKSVDRTTRYYFEILYAFRIGILTENDMKM